MTGVKFWLCSGNLGKLNNLLHFSFLIREVRTIHLINIILTIEHCYEDYVSSYTGSYWHSLAYSKYSANLGSIVIIFILLVFTM